MADMLGPWSKCVYLTGWHILSFAAAATALLVVTPSYGGARDGRHVGTMVQMCVFDWLAYSLLCCSSNCTAGSHTIIWRSQGWQTCWDHGPNVCI